MRRLLLFALGMVFAVVLFAGPAHAQYVGGNPPHNGPVGNGTHVLGEHFICGCPSVGGEDSFLASTGLNVAEFVGIGVVAIGVGTVMARRRRQRTAS